MKEMLSFIVKSIVENPKDISISDSVGSTGELTLELKVSPEDMGLVIGKGGKVIKAIRNLIRTKAILENKRVNLVLVED